MKRARLHSPTGSVVAMVDLLEGNAPEAVVRDGLVYVFGEVQLHPARTLIYREARTMHVDPPTLEEDLKDMRQRTALRREGVRR
jgi:hypothetical protein